MIKTVQQLGGWENILQFVLPCGLGDISFLYVKICHLKKIVGVEVLVYVACQGEQKRGGDLVEMLPQIHFGGYLEDRSSWEVHSQCLPSHIPAKVGWGVYHYKKPINLSANIHLEMGYPIKDWQPLLPVDYHYPINFTNEHINKAEQLIHGLKRPLLAIYISNNQKDTQTHGGWNLWNSSEWVEFLTKIRSFKDCSFLFLGADYDRDKTEAVAKHFPDNSRLVIGEPLGVALRCLQRSDYFFAFPSGIGILANVLRVPGVMLLPWLLKNLENVYADPIDLENNYYKAWADPTTDQVLRFYKNVGLGHVLKGRYGI